MEGSSKLSTNKRDGEMEFRIGMKLNINDESIGVISDIKDDQIFVESDEFWGWVNKNEMEESIITDSPTEVQFQNKRPRHPASSS